MSHLYYRLSNTDDPEERLEDERDQFLTLFLTQLQNQDPTSPMDTNEMTNQLVQFTAVEQQIETNKSLASLVSAQAANTNAAAVNYIGEHVIFNGNNTNLTDDGASWGYLLESEANSTTVNVFNAAGDLVYSEEGQTGSGDAGERVTFLQQAQQRPHDDGAVQRDDRQHHPRYRPGLFR